MTGGAGAAQARLLAAAGQANLAPLGLTRRGRSRVWWGDRRWWLPIVEFQPSTWGPGSHLNVAATWLWAPSDHLAFHEVARLGGFVPFEDAATFAVEADRLGRQAAVAVADDLARFASPERVAAVLQAKAAADPWDRFHAAMALLAVGDVAAAGAQQAALAAMEPSVPWLGDLQVRAERLVQEAARADPRAVVAGEVLEGRARLGLPPLAVDAVWDAG